MNYHVVLKISTVIDRKVEADSEDDIFDAIDEGRAGWDLSDVLVDMDEIEKIFIYDEETGTQRKIY